MDTEDHEKDPNAVLQSLLSTENQKNIEFDNSTGSEPSVTNVPIVHVYSEGSTVHYQSDGSELQQSVDLESLQWQNLARNEYSVGDALLWEGSVQVDQIDNLHSLEGLESTADGGLKKTDLFNNTTVSIPGTLQNSVLTLENISTLNDSGVPASANIGCIPNTPQISVTDSPPSNVPIHSLQTQTFGTSVQKSPCVKKKKQSFKPGSKVGVKKTKRLKKLPSVKGSFAKAGTSTQKSTDFSAIANSQHPINQNGIKKKINQEHLNPTALEDSASQVQDRFNLGCECQDSNCFDGLCSESVFRHRLNIAELTKAEHDMYLMGVTMACLGDPEHTNRNKERQRLRAKYVYQGRHVCLQAFLYLENCTLYQVKRIRKHVMTNGVVPRIHGNHGKKPHNRFPLELYCHATDFLKNFLRHYNVDRDVSKTTPLFLGPDVTRKSVHQAYLNFCETHKPDEKVMGYSTFRHFMKEQFPYIRFRQLDLPGIGRDIGKQHFQHHLRHQEHQFPPETPAQKNARAQKKTKVYPRTQPSNRKEETKPRPNSGCPSSTSVQDVRIIALTEVVMEGNAQQHTGTVDTSSAHPCLTDSGTVALLNTSVPLMSGSNFVMVSEFAHPKEGSPLSPGVSGNKTMTINSRSLRLVSANGVSASSLVPMNTLAMLGPGVFPIYLDTEGNTEQFELADGKKDEHIMVETVETSGDIHAQSKAS